MKLSKIVSKGYSKIRKIKNIKDQLRLIRDKEWSKAIKDRVGNRCEQCGSSNRLNSHHIITRANKSTRWNLDNGVCLCSGHHYNAHIRPEQFRAWLINKYSQEWFDKLYLTSRIK